MHRLDVRSTLIRAHFAIEDDPIIRRRPLHRLVASRHALQILLPALRVERSFFGQELPSQLWAEKSPEPPFDQRLLANFQLATEAVKAERRSNGFTPSYTGFNFGAAYGGFSQLMLSITSPAYGARADAVAAKTAQSQVYGPRP
jgi:hypothetical protein